MILLTLAGAQERQPQQDTSVKDRIRIAREAPREGSTAIPRVSPLLRDPILEVRIEAVKALVSIGTQHSLDPLIQATSDNDPEVQIRATDGLVNFYVPGYVQGGISGSLRRAGNIVSAPFRKGPNTDVIEPTVQVRPEIIEAIGRLASGGSSMTARANAARAVGVLRGRAALPHLYEALRSKDDQVMYEALIAIQKIADPASGDRVIFLIRDLTERIQVAAIETAGILLAKEAAPELRRVVETTSKKNVRRAALDALARLTLPENRDLIARYLNDGDPALRAAALYGLARMRSSADLPVMERAFNEERKMEARLAGAYGMVLLGSKASGEFGPLEYLVNTLNQRAWKQVAASYLEELARQPETRQRLLPVLAMGTRAEKLELAPVLSRTCGRECMDTLDRMAKDPDPEVAREGVRAGAVLRARLN